MISSTSLDINGKKLALRRNDLPDTRKNSEDSDRDDLLVSKQKTHTSLTKEWLVNYRQSSHENDISWEFPYKKQTNQYYSPIEFVEELDMCVSTDEGIEHVPVCFEINGHVIRLYDGSYRENQDIIITFDLKEISVALSSKEGAKDKLLIISRFHSRVFICELSKIKLVSISDIYSIVQINMDWARKYSQFKYPEKLINKFWKDEKYVPRAQFHAQNSDTSLGTITIVRQDLYGILAPDDGKPGVSLYTKPEDPVPKFNAKLTVGVSIWPKYGNIMKSFVFFIMCGKRAFQMHDIKGLERLYINCNMDKYITSKYEAKILSLISRYAKTPTPIEYRYHSSKYVLQPNMISEPLDPSKTTLKLRIDSVPIITTRPPEHSPQLKLSTQRIDSIETSMDSMMDKMTMVVNAVTELQGQIDNVENMQTQMADIMDMESQRVQNLELKIENVGTMSDTMEHFDVILDRLDYLEQKIEDTQKDISSRCSNTEHKDLVSRVHILEKNNISNPIPNLSMDKRDSTTIRRHRASVLIPSTTKPNAALSPRQQDSTTILLTVITEKIKQLEAQFSIQQTLNQAWQQQLDQMNDKLTKLTTVCQNLNSRLKYQ